MNNDEDRLPSDLGQQLRLAFELVASLAESIASRNEEALASHQQLLKDLGELRDGLSELHARVDDYCERMIARLVFIEEVVLKGRDIEGNDGSSGE